MNMAPMPTRKRSRPKSRYLSRKLRLYFMPCFECRRVRTVSRAEKRKKGNLAEKRRRFNFPRFPSAGESCRENALRFPRRKRAIRGRKRDRDAIARLRRSFGPQFFG